MDVERQPIMEFANDKQAYECLREWQERLFLNDWIVKLNLVEAGTIMIDNAPCAGAIEAVVTGNCAVISIEKLNDATRDGIVKTCHEQVLVHELLHCKYNWLERDFDRYEAAHFDIQDHARLEQMAKSLIMAKYDLPFEWFRNFDVPK